MKHFVIAMALLITLAVGVHGATPGLTPGSARIQQISAHPRTHRHKPHRARRHHPHRHGPGA